MRAEIYLLRTCILRKVQRTETGSVSTYLFVQQEYQTFVNEDSDDTGVIDHYNVVLYDSGLNGKRCFGINSVGRFRK